MPVHAALAHRLPASRPIPTLLRGGGAQRVGHPGAGAPGRAARLRRADRGRRDRRLLGAEDARRPVVGGPLDRFSPLVASCYVSPAIPEWPRVRTILRTNVQDAVVGKLNPEAVLRAAEQEVSDVLSRSRR